MDNKKLFIESVLAGKPVDAKAFFEEIISEKVATHLESFQEYLTSTLYESDDEEDDDDDLEDDDIADMSDEEFEEFLDTLSDEELESIVDEIAELDESELMEVSKARLVAYREKAFKDNADGIKKYKKNSPNMFTDKAGYEAYKEKPETKKLVNHVIKRELGTNLAAKKLKHPTGRNVAKVFASESVALDEVSKERLLNYVRKSTHSVGTNTLVNDHKKSYKRIDGVTAAAKKLAGHSKVVASESVDLEEGKIDPVHARDILKAHGAHKKDYFSLDHSTASALHNTGKKMGYKANDNGASYGRNFHHHLTKLADKADAMKAKAMKENVEQMDEVSKGRLKDYIKVASKAKNKANDMLDELPSKKNPHPARKNPEVKKGLEKDHDKRTYGIHTALNKVGPHNFAKVPAKD